MIPDAQDRAACAKMSQTALKKRTARIVTFIHGETKTRRGKDKGRQTLAL
jgi:hypothetical protein